MDFFSIYYQLGSNNRQLSKQRNTDREYNYTLYIVTKTLDLRQETQETDTDRYVVVELGRF